MKTGTIVIDDGHITVRIQHEGSRTTSCEYDHVTIESLMDAARVLGTWMDISHEDIAKECRRVHARDQRRAALREAIEAAVRSSP